MNSLKFATERSYDTASFAQRLQRKPRPRRATARNRSRKTCVLTESDANQDANQQTRQAQDVAPRDTPPARHDLPASSRLRQCLTPSSTADGCTPSPLPSRATRRPLSLSRNSPLESRHPASEPAARTKTAKRKKHAQGDGASQCCFCAASLTQGTRYQCQTCPEVAFCTNCKQNASFIHPNRGHHIKRIDNGGNPTRSIDRVHEIDHPSRGDATEARAGERTGDEGEVEVEVVDVRTTQPILADKCTLCGEILLRTWHECPTCVYKFCSSCTVLHPIHELVAVTGEATTAAGYADGTVDAESDDGHRTSEGVQIDVDEGEVDVSREGTGDDSSASEEANAQVAHPAEACIGGLKDVDMSDPVDGSDVDELDVSEPGTDDPGVDDDIDEPANDDPDVDDDINETGETDIADEPDVASSVDSDGDNDDEAGTTIERLRAGQDQAASDPLVPLSRVLPAIQNALNRFIRDTAMEDFMAGIARDLREGPSGGTLQTHQTRLNLLDFDLGLASLETRPHSAVRGSSGRHRPWLPEDRQQLARLKAKGWTDERIGDKLQRSAGAISQQWRKQRVLRS